MSAKSSLLAFIQEYWRLGAIPLAIIVAIQADLFRRARLPLMNNPVAVSLRALLAAAQSTEHP